MLKRVTSRTGNPYGKSAGERAEILGYYEKVLPLLRTSSDVELDTSRMAVGNVVDYLIGAAF